GFKTDSRYCISFFTIRTLHDYSSLISSTIFSNRSCLTFFFSSHSQTINTFQPISLSFLWFISSRSTFRLILGIQYSILEEGHTNRPQSCLCQKQPFTKITVLYFGSTISGQPGKDRTFFLYRN